MSTQFALNPRVETGIAQRLALVQRKPDVGNRVRIQSGTKQRAVGRLAGGMTAPALGIAVPPFLAN